MSNFRSRGDAAFLPAVLDRYAAIRAVPDQTMAALAIALPGVSIELAKFAARSGMPAVLEHQRAIAEIVGAVAEPPAKTLAQNLEPPRPPARSAPRAVGPNPSGPTS